jgi:hypothetical protein
MGSEGCGQRRKKISAKTETEGEMWGCAVQGGNVEHGAIYKHGTRRTHQRGIMCVCATFGAAAHDLRSGATLRGMECGGMGSGQ